jgi:hopanoid biosynthesis associated protein HpnK
VIIFNADDMGMSLSVNRAIAEAHSRGVINSASLMATGAAFEDALRVLEAHPGLSAGLHLTLCDGRSALPPEKIPDLAGPGGLFEESPARAGLKYWLGRKEISGQIEAEIEAQFDILEQAGIRPAHADSHHHLHAHPVVFDLLCRIGAARGVRRVRLPVFPLGALGIGRFFEWAAFRALAARNAESARRSGLEFARAVYPLKAGSSNPEQDLLELLSGIREPLAEVYSHPDTASRAGSLELRALTSPGAVSFVAG